MSYSVNTRDRHINLDEIYNAILAKELDHAICLYAELEGVNLYTARQTMSVMYRVFHLGYQDCLKHLSVDDMPGFQNKAYADVWRAGYGFALQLPTSKLNRVTSFQLVM
jgi:hypothetical protein